MAAITGFWHYMRKGGREGGRGEGKGGREGGREGEKRREGREEGRKGGREGGRGRREGRKGGRGEGREEGREGGDETQLGQNTVQDRITCIRSVLTIQGITMHNLFNSGEGFLHGFDHVPNMESLPSHIGAFIVE